MMTLQDLINLYILQKNYHLATGNKSEHPFQIKFNQFMINFGIEIIEDAAPALFPLQPRIPYVLFKPLMHADEKRPLIMHTHGGPHVRFYKSTPHAEIMYYLAQGYVVACPNYRGSVGHPEQDADYAIFKRFETTLNGLTTYAPEDIYTVALHLRNLSFIDATRITLRGGSFGSCTNAFLLQGIASGKFQNIFNGVHLSGGVDYPAANLLPKDIPILLSHGMKDDVAPCAIAEKLITQSKTENFQSLQVFLAAFGDHHLICPTLEADQIDSPEYVELSTYLERATNFVHKLNQMPCSVTAITERRQICETLVKRSWFLRQIKQSTLLQPAPVLSLPCPSEAHLYSLLQSSYSPDSIEDNIKTFLKVYFGYQETLINELTPSLAEMIRNERRYCHDHTVFYHGCSREISFAYDVYTTIYRSLYANNEWVALRPDHELLQKLVNIREFINYFHCEDRELEVNNQRGYNDCAVAANVFLFGSHWDKSSCSIKFYVEARSERPVDLSALLHNVLRPFNIPSDVIERLHSVFTQHYQSERGSLIQFYVPKGEAREYSYPSVNMGVLSEYHDSRDLPQVVDELRSVDLYNGTQCDYMKYLQARVLTPPHLTLRCNVLRQLKNSVDYQHALVSMIDEALTHMMMNYSDINPLNRKTPMVRILPHIFKYNDIAQSTQSPENLLVRSIQHNDEYRLRQVLLQFPALKNAVLTVPTSYIRGKKEQVKPSAATQISTIEFIMTNTSLSLSVLFDCYSADEAKNIITMAMKVAGTLSAQTKILKRVPREKLTEFSNYLEKPAFTGSYLYGFDEIVYLVSPTERMAFMKAHRRYLENDITLVECAKTLAENEIYEFVTEFKLNKISSGGIARLIKLAIPEDRLKILFEYKSMITDGCAFAECVKEHAELRTTDVLQHFSSVIKNSDDLSSYLAVLPTEMRYEFAWRHIDKHRSLGSLENTLKKLDEETRLTYAIAARERNISMTFNVFAILRVLPMEQRLVFMEYQIAHMTSSYDATNCIPLLPVSERANVAERLQHIFTEACDLASIASYLPEQADKIKWVNRALALTTDGIALWNILHTKDLSLDEKIKIANSHKHLITNWQTLSGCLKCLEDYQAIYLYSFIDSGQCKEFSDENNIKLNNILISIMKSLPSESRLKFLNDVGYQPTSTSAIISAYDGSNGLSPEDTITFIRANIQLIKSKDDVEAVARYMHKDCVHQYIALLPDHFSKPKNIMDLLHNIHSSKRLPFLLHYIDKFTPIREYINGWMSLITGAHMDYALALLPYLKTEDEFSAMVRTECFKADMLVALKEAWNAQMQACKTSLNL